MMWKKLYILTMLMMIGVMACTSNHYLTRSEPYRQMVDSLKQEDSDLTVCIAGKTYDITLPSFYGDRIYFKKEGRVSAVAVTEVEKINIENHLNTTEVLVFSFLVGNITAGIIGANKRDECTKN